MQALLLIIHVLVAVALVALVLLQHGKGADMGAAFGSGASSTMFGSQGATPFLVKVTGVIAFIFFCTSLALNYWVSEHARPVNILEVSDATLGIPVDQVHQKDNKAPGKN
jgi:preprotein translocase subunit SecG